MSKIEEASLAVEVALKEQEKDWPQVGDDFWVPGIPVGSTCYKFANTPTDARYFELGMAFQSEEQCLAEVKAREVIQALRSQPGTVPFQSGVSKKWCFTLQLEGGYDYLGINYYCSYMSSPLFVYFESREAASAALNAVGEDRVKAAIKWLHAREV